MATDGTTIRITEFKGQKILNIIEVDENGTLADKALISFGVVKAEKYSTAFKNHATEIESFIQENQKVKATNKETESTGPRW
jgi:hypothetical protein